MRWCMFVLIGAFLVASIVGAGLWYVAQPPLALFLVPGATKIQVVTLEPGTRLITYQAPGKPCDWYAKVAQTLVAQRWQGWVLGGELAPRPEQIPEPHSDPPRIRYVHSDELPLGYLWNQAVLDPDPNAEWSVARAPFYCHGSHADHAADHQDEPHMARIVIRRSILPSYWLVDRMQKLFVWLRR